MGGEARVNAGHRSRPEENVVQEIRFCLHESPGKVPASYLLVDSVRLDMLIEIPGDGRVKTQTPESVPVQLVRARGSHLVHRQMPCNGSAEPPVQPEQGHHVH